MEEGEPLSEPYPVVDQYVDDLGRLEVTGQNFRFVLVTKRERDNGEFDHEVVARIVMPAEVVLPAIGRILRHKFFSMMDLTGFLASVAKFWKGDHIVH